MKKYSIVTTYSTPQQDAKQRRTKIEYYRVKVNRFAMFYYRFCLSNNQGKTCIVSVIYTIMNMEKDEIKQIAD